MTDVVTVLIPTYCRADRLERAVRSALQQSYARIIIRIFDNASTDQTEAVVRRLALTDRRIEYVRHSSNIGMINNFNCALRSVETPFFMFLCDDDELLPRAISLQLAGMQRCPQVGFWGCHCLRIDERSGDILGGTWRHWRSTGVYSSASACSRIARGAHLEMQGMLFRTSAVRLWFPRFVESVFTNDVDIQFQLACRLPVGMIAKPLAIMYAHGQSISGGLQRANSYEPGFRIIDSRLQSALPASRWGRGCVRSWRWTSLVILSLLGAKNLAAQRFDEAGEFRTAVGLWRGKSAISGLCHTVLSVSGSSKILADLASILFRSIMLMRDPLLLLRSRYPGHGAKFRGATL